MKTTKTSLSMKSTRRPISWMMAAMLLTSAGWTVSCQDEYDLDEKLPPNFGSNLMKHLEGNNFKYYSRLAKDLNYVDALSGVSLKTLLAADDEAFERFFKSNDWGVTCYEDLSTAQKKMLFYNSMLDNSLQVLNLSSTTGAAEATAGNAMRRSGSGSIYDSVPIIKTSEMNHHANSYWKWYIEHEKDLVCMKDMTTKPILFFIEPFLQAKRITNADIEFLYNHTFTRQTGDATIGNTFVAEGNIRCPNGFIHRLNDVLVPLDNMAEIIRKKKQTSQFSSLLERFSAPYYAGREATDAYNYEYNTDIDSLFQKRYLAERSIGGEKNTSLPNNGPEADAYLRFDPGWNEFFSDQKGAFSPTVALQSNMGVMLVPTDKAMDEYWNEGAGKVIKDYYGNWDNVPNHVVAELINNGMLNSWVNSVPSKFDGIVNSNQDRMGIKPEDVDSVFLGCNGAVYLTNKVFPPTSFISVSFPATINETMSIFRWAIKRLEYRSYLNSLDSYYSFFIPSNEALLVYFDPVAYPGTQNQVWHFHYQADAETEEERVWAGVYQYDLENDVVGDSIGEVRWVGDIENRLRDVLDNHIVIGNRALNSNVENGHQFYRTKNGGVVEVKNDGGKLQVRGTLQRDKDKWLNVTQVYDQTESGGNGKTYIIGYDEASQPNPEPLMTTKKSVLDILSEHEEFSTFLTLLNGSSLNEAVRNKKFYPASDAGNIATFNNFNYTVYVPTNESLAPLFSNGTLYTWEQIEDFETRIDSDPAVTEERVQAMKDDIETFLRYHIQDNLLLIGLDYANDGGADYDEDGNLTVGDNFDRKYETAATYEVKAGQFKFYTLDITNTTSDITIKDAAGNTRKVVKKPGLYNLVAREYQLENKASISGTSFASIHLIDGPLFYKK